MTDVIMNGNHLREALANWISFLGLTGRAALSLPLVDESEVAEAKEYIDPDFLRWVHGDPMVPDNSASRYRSQPPGYLTSNGRGSLEIGAAED